VIYGSITILTKPARVYRLKILRDGGARRLANAHVKGGAEIAAGYIGWVEFYVRDNLVPYKLRCRCPARHRSAGDSIRF